MSYRPPKTTGAGSSRDVANPQYRLSRPSSSSQQAQSRIRLHQKQLPKKQNGANGGTSGFSPINRSQTTPRTAVAFAPLPNSAPAASSTTMSPNYRLQGSTASAGDGGGGAPSTTPSKKRKRRSTDQVLLDRNERLEMLDGIDGRKTRPERLPVIFTDDEDEDEEEEVEDREMEGYSDVNADAEAEGVDDDDDDANDEINMQFSRERNLNSPVRPYDGNDRFLQLVTSPRQKQKNKPSREQRTSGGQMPQSFIVSPETPGKLPRNAVANGGSIRPGLLSSKYGMDGSADDDDIDGEDWDTDFDQGGDDNEANEWDYNANDESPSKKAASLRRTSKSASKNKGDTTPATKKTITSTTTTSARGRRSRNIVDNDDGKDGNYEATEKLGKQQQLQEDTSGGGGDSGFGVRPKRTCTQASPPNYTAMQVISNSPGGKLGVVGEMTKKGSFEVTRTTKQKTSRTATAATATKRGRKPNTKNPFARADRVNESGDGISKKATTTTATTTTATTKPPGMKKGKFVPEDYEKFDDEDFMEVDENEQVEQDDATTTGSVIGTATLDGEEDEEEGTISTQQSEDLIPFAEAVATTTATTTGANKKKNTTKNNNKDMNTPKATSNASITSSRRNSTITVQQPPTPAAPAPLNNSPSSVHLDPKTFYPRLQSHLQHNITKYTSSYNKLINRGLTPAANIMRGKVEMAENDLEELKKRKKDLKYLAESKDLADVDEQVRWMMIKAQVKEWIKSDDWEEKV